MDGFLKGAVRFTRNPLGIIALFIGLVYGIAGYVFSQAVEYLPPSAIDRLTWFLVLFPCLVLVVFAWLVAFHHTKLYSPSDFRTDEGFLKALSPKDQKRRLETEVEQVQEEIETLPEPERRAVAAADNALDVRGKVTLSEDLAIRVLEQELGSPISRQVRIGDVGFDGVTAVGGTGYGIEVRYISGAGVNTARLAAQMASAAETIKSLGYRNFNLLLALVADDLDDTRLRTRLDTLYASLAALDVPVHVKLFSLEKLRAEFGV